MSVPYIDGPSARMDGALRVALLSQSEFGVAVCDSDGLLVELNPSLESMLSVPYEPSGLESWPRRYHLYDEYGQHRLAPEDAPLAKALRGEEVVDELISARPPARPIRYLRCNGARLHDEQGNVVGAVAFVVDVTAHITKRRELDALRERLVETINHELRTPLATVKGHAELLDDARDQLPPTVHWSLDAVGRALAQLEKVLATISEMTDQSMPAKTHESRNGGEVPLDQLEDVRSRSEHGTRRAPR